MLDTYVVPDRCSRHIRYLEAPDIMRRTNQNHDHNRWTVYALFNHDLEQIFIGASDQPSSKMREECDVVADEIVNWQKAQHRLEYVEEVESFPSIRHAKHYVAWLYREGAFEGAEHYEMGIDSSLQM